MWSWWDCMQWWSGAWDSAMPWPMFLPMLWPILMIGGIIVLVMLLMRGGRTETPPIWRRDASARGRLKFLASASLAARSTGTNTRSARDSCLNRNGIRAAIVRRLILERPRP